VRAGQPVTHMRSTNSKPSNQSPLVLVPEAISLRSP